MPIRIAPQDQPLYTPHNVFLTPETFSYPNAPYPTISGNVCLTPETASPPNLPYPTTLAVMSAKAAP